jgi:mortality factor 4-like protein 1
VRKFTEENKELAAQLHNQMKALQKQPKAGGKKGQGGRANGSDFSSARGSEERTASAAAQSGGRGGQRRARDYDIENVSSGFLVVQIALICSSGSMLFGVSLF